MGTSSSPASAPARTTTRMRRSRFTVPPDVARSAYGGHRRESADDHNAPECSCSCASVPSCAGMVIADCIALCCCCPCAAVSLLALALLRVPWALGRRCWRHLRTKRAARRRVVAEDQGKKKKNNNKTNKNPWNGAGGEQYSVSSKAQRGYYDDDGGSWDVQDEYDAMGRCSCAWREAEKVWMELYQAGQIGIGFGRVSFTGLPHRRSSGRSTCS